MLLGLMTVANTSVNSAVNCDQQSPTITQPKVIHFGASMATMQAKLEKVCQSMDIKTIEPPQIPNAQKQTQLDCQGFKFAGKERLAEFVFKDDTLILTWVLVEANELTQLQQHMSQKYGQAQHQNALFSAYPAHRTALRKDMPEILFYAEDAAAQFEAWFQSASQQ